MMNQWHIITAFVGPMFSGKSLQLIQQAHRSVRGGKDVLAVKPETDTRDSDTIVTSLHDPVNGDNTQWSYENVQLVSESDRGDLAELYEDRSPDVLIVDEIQFFDDWFVDFIRTVQQGNGTEVYLAGLDQTAWREPFGPTPQLLALADRVQKLQADCFVSDCSQKAQFTQLKQPADDTGDDSRIIVGGQETYEARCGDCWVHPEDL